MARSARNAHGSSGPRVALASVMVHRGEVTEQGRFEASDDRVEEERDDQLSKWRGAQIPLLVASWLARGRAESGQGVSGIARCMCRRTCGGGREWKRRRGQTGRA